jgi:hypothetical protein
VNPVSQGSPTPYAAPAGARREVPALPVRALLGAVVGLSWACGLRAYMAELAGFDSAFTWMGTFFAILTPGILTGAILGAAFGMDSGRTALLRWSAAAPLLFPAFTLVLPGQLATLVTTGMGSGALSVPLAGIAGGYAFAGRRIWLRIVGAVFSLASIIAVIATVPTIAQSPLTTPQGVWTAALVGSLLVVLMAAMAIPFRRMNQTPHQGEPAAPE